MDVFHRIHTRASVRSLMPCSVTEQQLEHILHTGQGGTPLASALAGKRTALVESIHVGGTCVNEGCTPTKTMVASARVAYLARRGADYGVDTGSSTIDLKKIRERKRDIVDSFRGGAETRIERQENLELIMGTARFTGPKPLEVSTAGSVQKGKGKVEIKGQTIIIDTGTRASVPALEGVEQVPHLDSTSIMELGNIPEHLLVIGGGYIGLEFGQMFRRFGSRVTIVHRGDQLLSREDQDVAAEVLKILQEEGIEVHLQSRTIRVEPARAARGSGGELSLFFEKNGEVQKVSGSHLLMAAGRKPNSDTLNLEAAGVQTNERGFIQVNSRLETSAPGIYAIGDVNGGPAGALNGVHRSSDRPHRPERERGKKGRCCLPCRHHADELGGSGSGAGRNKGDDEGAGGSKERANSGCRRSRDRRGRDYGHDPDRHDGRASLHSPAGGDFRPPHPCGIPEHPVRPGCLIDSGRGNTSLLKAHSPDCP